MSKAAGPTSLLQAQVFNTPFVSEPPEARFNWFPNKLLGGSYAK
jgi:hypothetical protein